MEALEKHRPASDKQSQELDRLFDLPEPLLLHILSFLPTKFAIRTSSLSRHHLHIWSASPSIDLDRSDFPSGRLFVDWTNRCILRRDPSVPLFRLSLKASYEYRLPIKSLSKWLSTSQSLRHLSLRIHLETFESLLPVILSLGSLESFSVDNIGLKWRQEGFVPSRVPPTFNLIHLKRLHLAAQLSSSDLGRLVSEQTNLEYFCYEPVGPSSIMDLSSPTMKMLKLTYQEFCDISKMTLFLPNLIVLDLTMSIRLKAATLLHFTGKMPMLRKAIIKIHELEEECVMVISDFLRCITNVEELKLRIRRLSPQKVVFPGTSKKRNQKRDEYPFQPLVQLGNEKDMPTFPNLKRLKLFMCFHELSIQDLVCLLHNSPVLESLQLVHVYHIGVNQSNRWISKLPLNSEGNNKYACFEDLHVGDTKMQVIKKLLCNVQLSKKPKIFGEYFMQ